MSSGVRGICLVGIALAAFGTTYAAELKEARVTQIVREVKLLPNAAPARPALVNDEVRDGTAVRTGIESRTELMFTDATLARLGANTIFSFTEGTRNLELTDGAMLLRVPKNAGGAKINTAAVTAAITGTTIMLEFHKNSYIKFIVLEGTGRIFIPNRIGESVLVHAGQMLITKPNAKNLPSPVDVDIRKLMKTSRLIKGFGKMGSEDLIAQTETKQDEERGNGELYETNLAIYGAGTNVILNDPTHIQASPQENAQAPSEFGPPETIPDPDAYPLGTSSQINTGPPTITSNGVTEFGKIYRTTPLDGTRSLWFFRSTRPFDTVSGFDTPDRSDFDLNFIAAFKFQDLQLTSNPTISISQGGITKLALIGVGAITSGPPGGTLTFAGLDSVLLATQNGSIILDSGISFENIPNLFFYARGDSVALKLASPISGSNNLLLNSEGTMQVNSNITVDNFSALSNADFQQSSGTIAARDLIINSEGRVQLNGNITGDTFSAVSNGDFQLSSGTIAVRDVAINSEGRMQLNGNITGDTFSAVSNGDFQLSSGTIAVRDVAINSEGRVQLNGNITGDTFSAISNGDFQLGSGVITVQDVNINTEGKVQLNGNITGDTFSAVSNGDFQLGSGIVTAHDLTINSIGGNVTFDVSNFPDVAGGTVDLTASGTLTIKPITGPITRASIVGRGGAIKFVSSEPFTFDFSNSNVSFTAGMGGIQAQNIDFVGPNLTLDSEGDINLLASHVRRSGQGIPLLSGSINAAGSILASGAIETADLQAGQNINAGSIYSGNIQAGGSINAANGIDATGGSIVAGSDITSTTGLLRLNRDNNNLVGNITAGGNIFAGGGILTSADSSVTAAGDIFTSQVVAGTLTAGGNITVDNSSGQFGAGVLVDTTNAATISFINTSRVSPIYAGIGNNAFSPRDFSMTVGSLNSTGPAIPILFANGLDSNLTGSSAPGNGGNVTLNVTLDGLVVAPDGDFTFITANGGRFNANGPFTGGNGGVINVTAAGPIEIDAPIGATTGYLQSPFSPHGNGGTVNLTSTDDSVAVNSRIEVSSADSGPTSLQRHSARGGNIGMKSGKPTGVAIKLSNTSELLSLLDAAAPGPGGKVTILATGANSTANVNGKIAADRGTIDIRHSGDSGQIFLGGPGEADHIEAHADAIKVGALGNNGVLTVGHGQLTADTTLKLYSAGSNGTVNFVADVTLGGASTKIIAGNTVNIFNGVIVTVGGKTPASVFTNNANYTGFGGNGSRTGTFAGAGANNPLPLNHAPAFDGPGG